ncbi:MAG TPA: P-II family nitrogen regulator [Bacillota bacterium]|nr:P-II family nitrogen regulator [Bacillota bacterium]
MEAMFFAVINRGKANAVLRKAEEFGARGGTIFLGEGTVPSRLLEQIGLAESHKEILMISASEELCSKLHDMVCEEFMFSKRNRGIAFTIPFRRRQLQDSGMKQASPPAGAASSHFCIITIVDKGSSKDCLKAARDEGARGGTLIHGRGAGVPTEFYYPLVIEPQKDIIIIIAPRDKVAPIRDRISTELELEKPGKGILFILPVIETSGLFENESGEHGGVAS